MTRVCLIVILLVLSAAARAGEKPRAITMAELPRTAAQDVAALELTDYVFGNYKGEFPSPPHADLNPRRAIVVLWKDKPYRFIFWHEASYCPFFELLPSGAAACFQFFEGNDGWAELFNDFGRRERNSFVDVIEPGPGRVWVRWTYFGVNMKDGAPAYRATEDFWAFPNGLVLRRQTYQTLMPGDHRGYAREPIELIVMCPVGKRWADVLRRADANADERHALAALDPFSADRYDLFWKPVEGKVWESTQRHAGAPWKAIDDARGVALVLPMTDGSPFCVFGDASGFPHDLTRIKEHTFDPNGQAWNSLSWDHWPVGWLNSQAHPIDADTLKKYPNHFSPVGMDLFAMPNEAVEKGVYYSLHGVGAADGKDLESVRGVARSWLDAGAACVEPAVAAKLTPWKRTPQ